jgi:hypothetical protein
MTLYDLLAMFVCTALSRSFAFQTGGSGPLRLRAVLLMVTHSDQEARPTVLSVSEKTKWRWAKAPAPH